VGPAGGILGSGSRAATIPALTTIEGRAGSPRL